MAAEELIVQTAQRRGRAAEPLDMHIGQVLLRAGKITESDIKRIVSLQSGREIRFGDAALSLGMVERSDIQQALSLQFAYPYLHEGDSALSSALVAAYQPFGAQAESMANCAPSCQCAGLVSTAAWRSHRRVRTKGRASLRPTSPSHLRKLGSARC